MTCKLCGLPVTDDQRRHGRSHTRCYFRYKRDVADVAPYAVPDLHDMALFALVRADPAKVRAMLDALDAERAV